MVPNAAVTAEVPELVSARPLASLWITKLKELATVIETAIVADALADAEAGLTSATRTKRIDTGKAIFFMMDFFMMTSPASRKQAVHSARYSVESDGEEISFSGMALTTGGSENERNTEEILLGICWTILSCLGIGRSAVNANFTDFPRRSHSRR